ncbi:FecR family protein [Caballeronia mineralivorans]|uniref:FecR family protein n=1 Tax=Caballeronia mineralivorans TaxID=2010198 RepID=UPI000AF3BF5B|nr:FecR domain-containing protein [Caballeronia mineralivorans]
MSAVGEQVTLSLDDGSQALLNTDTEIRYVRRLRSREVFLERGEAHFTVVHNEWHPFYVRAGQADVQDIGTTFSVRRLDNGVNVTVLEGRAAVTPNNGSQGYDVSASQAISTSGGRVVWRPDAIALLAWKDHRLDFDKTPVAEVVNELRRYRKAPIVLADAKAGLPQVSGGFSSADPDRLLRTLPAVARVTVSFKADGTAIIVSR